MAQRPNYWQSGSNKFYKHKICKKFLLILKACEAREKLGVIARDFFNFQQGVGHMSLWTIKSIFSFLISISFTSLVFFSSSGFASEAEPVDLDVELRELENLYESLRDAKEKNIDSFLKTMTKDPIDYEKLNNVFKTFGEAVSRESDVVNSLEIGFQSVLSGKFHKWATIGERFLKLPYYFPFSKTTMSLSFELSRTYQEFLDIPVNIRGGSASITVNQSLISRRGFLDIFTGKFPSWTDTYKGQAQILFDTMEALKKIYGLEEVQEACFQNEADNDSSLNGIDVPIDLREIVERTCSVVEKIDSYSDFNDFLLASKEDLESINLLVKKAIDEAWSESHGDSPIGKIFEFTTDQLYSYDLSVQDCQPFRWKEIELPFQRKFYELTNCWPQLELSAGGGALIGDADGDLILNDSGVSVSLSGDLSSGVRSRFIADKVEIATEAYMVLKTISSATDYHIEVAAKALGQWIEESTDSSEEIDTSNK